MTDNQGDRVAGRVPKDGPDGSNAARELDASPTASPDPAIDSLGFDQVITRLRTVIAQLENGNLSLEASLRVYEEGVGLARHGHVLLDNAEKRVELLVRDKGGGLAAVPLDRADPAGPADPADP